jgi:hypothetical protein
MLDVDGYNFAGSENPHLHTTFWLTKFLGKASIPVWLLPSMCKVQIVIAASIRLFWSQRCENKLRNKDSQSEHNSYCITITIAVDLLPLLLCIWEIPNSALHRLAILIKDFCCSLQSILVTAGIVSQNRPQFFPNVSQFIIHKSSLYMILYNLRTSGNFII